MFRFCLLSSSGEFCGGGDSRYLFFQGEAPVEEVGSTLDNSMKGSVCVCMCEELGFFFPSVVLKELGVSDGVDMGVLRGSVGGFLEVRVVAGDVGSVGEVEIFGLVEGFVDG